MMTSHLPGGSERCCSRNCLDYIHDEPAIQSCGVSSESSWLQHVWFVCPLLFTQCLTCIGITDNESCGAFAYGLNEWSHLFCPQSTVQTNTAQRKEEGSYWEAICHHWFVLHLEEQLFGLMYSNSPERISMRYAHYKGFSGLTRQSPSTAVHNGPWDLYEHGKNLIATY